ncbi:restriction endonuclease subunit S [Alkaliphilus metalliredigens]|uniref:restriction endonuclease subunit S n=1 Tax=Alkaliphilus metalliredigens TaxID=208226 RepID=UPI00005CAD84|nr:restriction endonuclease subunit S [Alkaliphilus metalliredigens]
MGYSLEEVATFQKGFAFKSKDFIDKGTKLVKVSNLTDDSVNANECVNIDEGQAQNYNKYSLVKDDIIITTVGSWPTNPTSVVGKVVKVPDELNNSLLNQNAVRLRGNEKVVQNYLYYLLKSNDFKEYIIGTAQGSANQASITQKDIKSFKYEIPNKPLQKSIAHILTTLDEKIEVNNQINKNLETMVQAIFKQWFVTLNFLMKRENLTNLAVEKWLEVSLG